MPEERLGRTKAQLSAAGLKQCPYCPLCIKFLGFDRHVRTCKSARAAESAALQASRTLLLPPEQSDNSSLLAHGSNLSSTSTSRNLHASPALALVTNSDNIHGISEHLSPNTLAGEDTPYNTCDQPAIDAGDSNQMNPPAPEEGTIRVVYTPRPNRLHAPETYLAAQSPKMQPAPVFTGDPWSPFRSRQDFEFADVALDAGLSKANTDTLLRLFHESQDCKITLKKYEDLRDFQKKAARLMAPFEPVPFQVPYKPANSPKTNREYEVQIKPLHDWLTELVHDESIQQHLQFDARKKYRWSEGSWHRIIDEPWTTDEWENKQNQLPADGLPLNIHLYADRAAVAMFGSKKVYPVVARLANLPRELRNGKGVGGGRVVALLPVVEEPVTESGRTALADLKCAVWHAALDKLVESIRSAARVGHAAILKLSEHLGLDGTRWRLFPSIHILSADYEEQIVIACNRGINAKCPCVRCLVPLEELHNLDYKADARDPSITAELIRKAQTMGVTKAEDLLKPYSLRPVQNVFLTLGPNTNPFQALSYDTLHNDDLGRWGKHIWTLLKGRVSVEPGAMVKGFESRIDSVPPWPDLNHFANPLGMDISDGQKYYDLLKACTDEYGKSFSFPKMHSLVHLFDDIWMKGATANFSTKPGESMHGPLRKAYLSSSKKSHSVSAEIANKTHLRAVYELIKAQIDLFDCDPGAEDEPETNSSGIEVTHIYLGSKNKSFQALEAFDKSGRYLNSSGTLQQAVKESLGDLALQVSPSAVIQARECKTIKVQYESMVDWCLHRDVLHCSPGFYLKERRDCVLVNSDDGVALARLLLLLECKDAASPPSFPEVPLALVSYFDPVFRPISAIERAIGFRRFMERSRERAQLIPARSIIRGALLAPVLETGHPNEYLANDIFEPDLYFRYRMYTKENKL
ncbi:hypothetical protein FRC06_003502 [Ceratobasidium sp. 370]|nr:hypothetical protein FRC06_003502 [Ceratobasidium sp. 370]